jgi:hypothetical protein
VLWATGIECYWCSPEYRHLWCDRGLVDVLQRIVWKPIQDVDVVAHHRATDTCVLVAVGHLTGQHNTGSITKCRLRRHGYDAARKCLDSSIGRGIRLLRGGVLA